MASIEIFKSFHWIVLDSFPNEQNRSRLPPFWADKIFFSFFYLKADLLWNIGSTQIAQKLRDMRVYIFQTQCFWIGVPRKLPAELGFQINTIGSKKNVLVLAQVSVASGRGIKSGFLHGRKIMLTHCPAIMIFEELQILLRTPTGKLSK